MLLICKKFIAVLWTCWMKQKETNADEYFNQREKKLSKIPCLINTKLKQLTFPVIAQTSKIKTDSRRICHINKTCAGKCHTKRTNKKPHFYEDRRLHPPHIWHWIPNEGFFLPPCTSLSLNSTSKLFNLVNYTRWVLRWLRCRRTLKKFANPKKSRWRWCMCGIPSIPEPGKTSSIIGNKYRASSNIRRCFRMCFFFKYVRSKLCFQIYLNFCKQNIFFENKFIFWSFVFSVLNFTRELMASSSHFWNHS